jgi:hypothetical protein
MFSAKCAPIAERSTLGDHAKAQPFREEHVRGAGGAALRSSVPTLPGSWMSSSASTRGALGGTLRAPGVGTTAITPEGRLHAGERVEERIRKQRHAPRRGPFDEARDFGPFERDLRDEHLARHPAAREKRVEEVRLPR